MRNVLPSSEGGSEAAGPGRAAKGAQGREQKFNGVTEHVMKCFSADKRGVQLLRVRMSQVPQKCLSQEKWTPGLGSGEYVLSAYRWRSD